MDHIFNKLNRNSDEDLRARISNMLIEDNGQLKIK